MTTILAGTLAFVVAIGVCMMRALMAAEVKGRIQRRIETSLEKTIAALPDDVQQAWAEEWRAELAAVIEMPLSALRFVCGARRSTEDLVGEWRLASEVGRDPELIALRDALTPGRMRSRGDPSNRDMWQRCEQLLPDVLAVGERLAGGSHDDVLGVLRLHNTVTRYLLDAGKRPRAVVVAQRTLQLAEAAVKRHPVALTEVTPLTQAWLMAHVQRAEVGQWAGDTRSPLQEAEQIALACTTVLGSDHPITLDARAVVALWYQWRGRLTEATELTQDVADDRAKIQGDKGLFINKPAGLEIVASNLGVWLTRL